MDFASTNLESIPDAWLYGENFNLLVEVKVVGTLNDRQICDHKNKFKKPVEVLEFSWKQVSDALKISA